ncbi:MAG: hypothetical protein M1136_08850 [Chloroflexi bacterium]|nr:hypothetical protein [Chloroflexota bacterium]
MRTHIFIPEELMKEIDRIAGKRKRSRFIELAIRERLARETLSTALRESVGVLNVVDYPEWESVAKISAWVRSGRKEDDSRLARRMSGRRN